MAVHRLRLACSLVLLALLLVGSSRSVVGAEPADGELRAAVDVQNATRARLRVLGDAFTCPEARFVSYRRSDAEPELADQWYVASQLWADAALYGVLNSSPPPDGLDWDSGDARCHLAKGVVFLDRLWDYTSGGYFARSNPVGTQVDRGARFGDDNTLAGLAFLAMSRLVDDVQQQQYLHAARREADFLLGSGLWDGTFGGGFWWNTNKGDTPEGKPAQTNALAALFFGRLYEATGEGAYREAALRSLLWLDTILYDPARQAYRWSVAYQDPTHRAGAPVVSNRLFNYDQSLAIEAEVLAARLDGDPNRLTRARAIGQALPSLFSSQDGHGYNLEAGIEQVYTSYAAWSSLGHLALYDLDQDPQWLELVQANVAALDSALREADAGYAYRVYRCVDRIARGCESGQARFVVDHTRDTTAQAWPQQLRASLAARLQPATPPPAEPEDGAAG